MQVLRYSFAEGSFPHKISLQVRSGGRVRVRVSFPFLVIRYFLSPRKTFFEIGVYSSDSDSDLQT